MMHGGKRSAAVIHPPARPRKRGKRFAVKGTQRGIDRIALAILAFATVACGGGSDDAGGSGWSGEIRDSAGIVVVSNPETGIWTDETTWIAERDLVIGADQPAGSEYEFGRIADIDADANGRIYILDDQAAKVSVYETDGRFALSFGRLGRGPGEFSIDAFAARVQSDGTVVVRDGINRRDNLFTGDGVFLRAVPFTASFTESAGLSQGNRIERAKTLESDVLLHVAPDGAIIDTVVTFEYDIRKSLGVAGSAGQPGGGSPVEIHLLPAIPAWGATSDGRIIAGTSNRYRIEVRRPDGVLAMLIDKEHDPLGMESEEHEQLLDRVRQLMRDAGLSEDAVTGVFQRFSYIPPDSLPAFTDIVGGPDGTIWVQTVLPVESMNANETLDVLHAGSPIWDVFCGDGRYLGQVALPVRFQLLRVKGAFLYGIEQDDLDVERAVRLRIRSPQSASASSHSC